VEIKYDLAGFIIIVIMVMMMMVAVTHMGRSC
jgi:hypothetical protein